MGGKGTSIWPRRVGCVVTLRARQPFPAGPPAEPHGHPTPRPLRGPKVLPHLGVFVLLPEACFPPAAGPALCRMLETRRSTGDPDTLPALLPLQGRAPTR